VQSEKDACDINQIVKRLRTGGVINVNTNTARYGDVSSVPDYQTALDVIRRAEGLFAGLPSNVRARFANDPGMMIDFLQDPANRDEGVRLGLIVAPAPAPVPEAPGRASIPPEPVVKPA